MYNDLMDATPPDLNLNPPIVMVRPAAASSGLMRQAADALSSPSLDASANKPADYSLASPSVAFGRLNQPKEATVPVMGTTAFAHTTYMTKEGEYRQMPLPGITRQERPDLALYAGSYDPDPNNPQVRNWTVAAAYTPVNFGRLETANAQLRAGVIVQDFAQIDTRQGAAKPVQRLGTSVGLHLSADGKDGGAFVTVIPEPGSGKLRLQAGIKAPLKFE